jgi:hypothetical protein
MTLCRIYYYRGRMMSNSELASLAGISRQAMYVRLTDCGMSAEEAVSHQFGTQRDNPTYTHVGITDTVAGWAKRAGMRRDTLRSRIAGGWTLERALTEPVGPRGPRANRDQKNCARA